jgi:ketosteroid isomerase-like protein
MGVARFVYAVVVLSFAAVAGATLSTAAVTRPAIDRALLAPIDALVVAMNRSDDRAIAELMTRDAVIMDEVAPYRWTGPNAEEHWSHDDGQLIRKRGVTASHSARGMPTFVHRNATHAFVMVPLAYDYTVGGKRQHETGLWTIVMVRTGEVWRIALLGFAKTGDTSDATWDG